ncbi:unnamed protein product, partial [Tetraodon nigroviridis]
DDWQEEHKRLAELDETDELGLGEPGIRADSGLGDDQDVANRPAKQHSLSSSLPLPNFSTFPPHLPPPGLSSLPLPSSRLSFYQQQHVVPRGSGHMSQRHRWAGYMCGGKELIK